MQFVGQGKDYNMKKALAVCTTALLAIGLAVTGIGMASADPVSNPGQGQETCPDGSDGWIKTNMPEGSELTSLTVNAPDGKLIAETCVKAATVVQRIPYDPAVVSVTLESPATNQGGTTQAISHYALRLVDVPTAVTDPCPAYDFPSEQMWEVTWGHDFTDRNGGLPTFTMESNGGLVGVNGGPVPTYMTNYGAGWHWLYVTTDRVVTYQFADGTVRTATVTGTECTPSIVWTETPPVTNVVCAYPTDGGVATNFNANGWTDRDTRAAGHAEYVDGGLHIYTDDASSQAKVSWQHALNIPLSEVGQLAVDYTNNQPGWFQYGPGLNLYIDITGDGVLDGTLVYEPVYGQDLWVTSNSAQAIKDASVHTGGNGSENHGTINHYLTTFPNATVVGFAFALGSGVHADGVLHSVTVGCTVFSFDHEVKAATIPAPTVVDVCGTANDGPVFPSNSEGVTWKVSSKTTMDDGSIRFRVVATPIADYVIPAPGEGDSYKIVDGKAVWLLYTTDEPCITTITTVPEGPTFTDKCGTANDTTTLPEDTEEFTYSKVVDGNTVTVTATPVSENMVFAEGIVTSWSYTFTNELCPTELPTPPALAYTGADGLLLTGGVLGGAFLLLSGAALVLWRRA